MLIVSKFKSWSDATVTYTPDGLVQLCLPARRLGIRIGTTLRSEASVTDIPAGSAPRTADVLTSQYQLIQTYLLVRCNSNRYACW